MLLNPIFYSICSCLPPFVDIFDLSTFYSFVWVPVSLLLKVIEDRWVYNKNDVQRSIWVLVFPFPEDPGL
jgi:hypothetical protein